MMKFVQSRTVNYSHYPRKVTLYLGIRMKYEAGNCAIVISMKRPLKWCLKSGF